MALLESSASLAVKLKQSTVCELREDLADNAAVDVRQAEVTTGVAVRQLFVVEPQ